MFTIKSNSIFFRLLTGSPAEKNDLEIGDEILEVNGRTLETCSHEEILTFIHEVRREPLPQLFQNLTQPDLDLIVRPISPTE